MRWMGRTKRSSREVERWFGTTLQLETTSETGQAGYEMKPESRPQKYPLDLLIKLSIVGRRSRVNPPFAARAGRQSCSSPCSTPSTTRKSFGARQERCCPIFRET